VGGGAAALSHHEICIPIKIKSLLTSILQGRPDIPHSRENIIPIATRTVATPSALHLLGT
jgi:hypothetical protein